MAEESIEKKIKRLTEKVSDLERVINNQSAFIDRLAAIVGDLAKQQKELLQKLDNVMGSHRCPASEENRQSCERALLAQT